MLDEESKANLRNIVGPEWFLDSPEDIATYSYDAFLPEFVPDGVVVPDSAQEISQIMTLANEKKINIVPRGAGTNISGTAVARRGGVIMAFHRMNKILEIDVDNMCAVVQPGVVNADLQREVAKHGLMYPPDPASMFVSTIGGNVALNAGGPRGAKYGVTRDYLLGLEVVLPTGEIIRTGGKTLKNVTGYDLTRLFCGSEGTLGIITEIIVRLIPQPPAKATLQAVFSDLDDAAKTVSAIVASGIVPTTLELIDRVILDIIRDYGGAGFASEAEALLLIEVDGETSAVEEQGRRIERFCKERGAIATVPVKHLPAVIRKIVELAEKYQLKIGVLAHAGDGNLHPLIMTDLRDRGVDKALDEMYEVALSMGGTLSGEHGIGIAKDRFITKELSPKAIEVMRGIKRVFDPNNILNPGSFL
ncbi:MAG: FAD-binding protein [Deltaproteobacteria bacterium]|nr:FAD-binding protein [Deltaproteobacteria bacterium]